MEAVPPVLTGGCPVRTSHGAGIHGIQSGVLSEVEKLFSGAFCVAVECP